MTLDKYPAYNWSELLEKCCEKMDIDKNIMKTKGSYPEIASKMCKQYSLDRGIEFIDAVRELKLCICELTMVFPDEEIREMYESFFDSLKLSWVTTTNYDTIVESILGGKALPISPSGCFTKISGMVPVYHLHGICNMPESVVITNEDYAYLFRPNDYRQARLPFLMKESLVLMIGYGLGDINVITAVDWSNNVYTNTSEDYDFPIIQLLYCEEPKEEPYQLDNGIYVYEVSDINDFFEELIDYYDMYQNEYKKLNDKINEYIEVFFESSSQEIAAFIDNDDDYRNQTISFVSELPREFGYIYISYNIFIKAVIEELNERSRPNGAFEAYANKLSVILEILEKVPVEKMPVSFFVYIAEALDSVARFVGDNMGQSWKAQKIWNENKDKLPSDVVHKLMDFANANINALELKGLLKDIKIS